MKKLTLGKKLYAAFGVLIVLLIIVGGVSIYRLTGITDVLFELQTEYSKIDRDAMKIQIDLLKARRHEKDFLARKDKKYLESMAETLKGIQETTDRLTATANRLGLTDIAAAGHKVTTAKNTYKTAFGRVVDLIDAQGDASSGIRGELRTHAHEAEGAIKKSSASTVMIDYLMMRRHEKDFILRENNTYVQKAKDVLGNLKTHANDISKASERNKIIKSADAYLASFEKLAKNIAAMKAEYPVMRQAAHDLEGFVKKIHSDVTAVVRAKQAEAMDQKTATVTFLYIFCGAIVLIGFGLAIFSVRTITTALNRIITGMNDGADQVASASSQVSSASQSLAEGSAEQAASIEETSSSLEELSSMTQQNADNASQADNLMKEANRVVGQANTSMSELTIQMGEISKASEETQKIIKTIDEVAFQTNLLALNAAVEAARAGEAGAGFAVVADEVRNLAIRSAAEAKNTADLIEGTVKKVHEGTELVSRTNEAFAQVSESAGKVGELVGEIAAASSEQSQGLGQINTAVAEMDKVVQRNAANAEESASASEELNAQAEQMKTMVNDLVALVGGSSGKTAEGPGTVAHSVRAATGSAKSPTRHALPAPAKKAKGAGVQQEKEINPAEAIPFDDDDFKEF